MSSPFTKDEIGELYAPFPLAAHSIREGYKNKAKTKVRWFVYLDRVAVQRRLDELFTGEWEFSPTEIHRESTHITITAQMTIRGVSRSFIGGNSPNYNDEPLTEDLEKGAITDTFRRVASVWGLGAYLYDSVDIWTDGYEQGNWSQRRERENEAKRIFERWYTAQFAAHEPPQNGNGTPKETAAPVRYSKEEVIRRSEFMYNAHKHAVNSITKMIEAGEIEPGDTDVAAVAKVFEHRAKSNPFNMAMPQVYEALTIARDSDVPVGSLKQWIKDGGTMESAWQAVVDYHENAHLPPAQPKGKGNGKPEDATSEDIPFEAQTLSEWVNVHAISHRHRGKDSRGKFLQDRWTLHFTDSQGKEGARQAWPEHQYLFEDCGLNIEWPYNRRLELGGVIPVQLDSNYKPCNVGEFEPI